MLVSQVQHSVNHNIHLPSTVPKNLRQLGLSGVD